MPNKSTINDERIEQFNLIVSKVPEIDRKGKTSPYTSVNGNMFTMMRKDGALGMRLSKEDRASFIDKYNTVPFENYGSMIKEYVEVPNEVFMNTDLMVEFIKSSYEYTKTLKVKASKKKTKVKSTAKPKKVTHEVGMEYKNGQIKAEVIGNELISYFEDGSIKAKGKIKNEQMQGKWCFNRKGGQLLQIGNYIDDIKNGDWIRYDSKNQVVYHVIFKDGKVTEKIV